jgi:hypothetical protein
LRRRVVNEEEEHNTIVIIETLHSRDFSLGTRCARAAVRQPLTSYGSHLPTAIITASAEYVYPSTVHSSAAVHGPHKESISARVHTWTADDLKHGAGNLVDSCRRDRGDPKKEHIHQLSTVLFNVF